MKKDRLLKLYRKIPVMKLENIFLLILVTLFFVGIGIKNNPIFSFTYHQGLTIAAFVGISGVLLFKDLLKEKGVLTVAFLWLVYSGILNVFLNDKGRDIAFILKMPMMILLYLVLKKIHLSQKSYQIFLGILGIAYFLYFFKMVQVEVFSYNLTLNKENSSTLGIAVAFTLFFALPLIRYHLNLPKKMEKLLIGFLYLFSLALVFLLGARTILFIILFYGFFDLLFPKKWKKKEGVYLTLFIGVFLLGFLFPVLYVTLLNHSEFLADKDFLTGRQVIWSHLFTDFFHKAKIFLFGFGIDRQYGRWSHEHNGIWSILMRYGLVGGCFYLSFWVQQIHVFFKKHTPNAENIAYLYGMLAVFFLSYTEPLIGLADYFIPICLLLALGLQGEKEPLGGIK